jgi:hypothetical protein
MSTAALRELEREVSRRGFLQGVIGGTGLALSLGPAVEAALGADRDRKAEDRLHYDVFGALGRIVIPVDQDPGWETFEPDITNYGLDVFVGQVFLNGNSLAIGGFKQGLGLLNEIPASIQYGPRFLEMNTFAKNKYFSDILTTQFENDGVQEILDFIFILSLVGAKAVFFSNFPRHQARVGAEYQVIPPSNLRTGWDIMRWKGPVGPDEEKALREKYFDVEVFPGVDPNNPYI